MIRVHDDGRNELNRCNKLLIVTSDATYLKVKFNADNGFVQVYGGGVWPGELPEIFEKRGRATAHNPSNTFVRQEVLNHFRGSMAKMEFSR